MAEPGVANGAPDAPDSAVPPTRPASGGLRGRAGISADGAARQALDVLYNSHYQSLVRLAALLTGDAQRAEEIATESLIALVTRPLGTLSAERTLFQLYRQVVIRSRWAVRVHRTLHHGQLGRHVRDHPRPESEWQSLPTLRVLAALPASHREAVVLRHYLGLSEEQTAAVMGTSVLMVRRSLASAKQPFQAVIPECSGSSQN